MGFYAAVFQEIWVAELCVVGSRLLRVPVAKKADEVGFFGSGEFQHQRADHLSR